MMTNSIGLAWAAGLIEGEGWIGLKRRRVPELRVSITDRDVTARLVEATGCGRSYQLRRPTVAGKAVYVWIVQDSADAAGLLMTLWPFLCARRRERAREVLRIWRSVPAPNHRRPACAHGHPLTGSNVQLRDGRRRCRACGARRMREHRARLRAA
jgi:hypothetical protein